MTLHELMVLHRIGLATGHGSDGVNNAVGLMINQCLAALVEFQLAGQGSITGCMATLPMSWTEPIM